MRVTATVMCEGEAKHFANDDAQLQRRRSEPSECYILVVTVSV